MVAIVSKDDVAFLGTTCTRLSREFKVVDDFTGGALAATPGELTWRFTGQSNVVMAVQVTAGTTGHPGVLGISTGATAVGWQSMLLANAASNSTHPFIPADVSEFMWIFNCFVEPDDTFRAGLMNNVTSEPTVGVYIERHSAESTWFAVSRRSAVSAQRVDTGVAFAANTWVKVLARREDAGWRFRLNDGTETAVLSAEPPTNVPLHAAIQVTKDSTSTRGFGVDFFAIIGRVDR